MAKNELPSHLGGHMNKTHIDYGSVRYMRANFGGENFLDIGCGPGGQLMAAQHEGYSLRVGVDGDYTLFPETDQFGFVPDYPHAVLIHDFCTGPTPYADGPVDFDLGWTVEFVEHVEEQFIPNYMTTLARCRHVIMTHALPGQAGHHHVNCKNADYWKRVFNRYGLVYDENLTNAVRNASTMRKPFIKRTGMVFRNEKE